MNRNEVKQLEEYLRKKFKLNAISVKNRLTKDDSAEVYIGEEFIGVLFKDTYDEDLSYTFEMTILDYDLRNT